MVGPRYNRSAVLAEARGYKRLYRNDRFYELKGVSDVGANLDLQNQIGTELDLAYYTFWGDVPGVGIGDRPSPYFKLTGARSDPMNVYSSVDTGAVYMAPLRTGNYTMWTVAVDRGRRALLRSNAFPDKPVPSDAERWSNTSDAVVIARWDFAVEGTELSVAVDRSGARITRAGVRYTDPTSPEYHTGLLPKSWTRLGPL